MPDEDAGAPLSLLEQREIEARIVGPLIRAVRAELGEEKTLALVRGVIAELARQSGAELAQRLGEASLAGVRAAASTAGRKAVRSRSTCSSSRPIGSRSTSPAAVMPRCTAPSDSADLGSSLSCQRDFSLIEGFNPAIELSRTQTIMEGRRLLRLPLPRRRRHRRRPNRPSDPDPALRLKSAGQFSENNDCMDHDRGSSSGRGRRGASFRTDPDPPNGRGFRYGERRSWHVAAGLSRHPGDAGPGPRCSRSP